MKRGLATGKEAGERVGQVLYLGGEQRSCLVV